jgi:hypothetical protein
MEVNFIKIAGGVLVPASQLEVKRMERFKNGDVYEIQIKLARNGNFHGKVFAFFNFCFQYWNAEHNYPFADEATQFDEFRKELTKLAGFKVTVFKLDGTFEIKAKSLSFESMDQEEFERLYVSLIDTVMNTLFQTDDKKILEKLFNFFN